MLDLGLGLWGPYAIGGRDLRLRPCRSRAATGIHQRSAVPKAALGGVGVCCRPRATHAGQQVLLAFVYERVQGG